MNKTSIEWTHRPETGGEAGGFTWNPIRARVKPEHISNPAYRPTHSGTFCTRISPGCTNCYASTINKRFGNELEYTVPNLEKVEFFIDEKILEEPLRRKKSATIFVGDMFDLFHEAIPGELIWRVLVEIREARQHTFQLLTKRAEIMRRMITHIAPDWGALPNVWLGVSVESRKYADERIPLLLQTPAAVRFLSVEPMLEAISLRWMAAWKRQDGSRTGLRSDAVGPSRNRETNEYDGLRELDWLICGGESGPGARPFNLAWAESLLGQCRDAGVPFFMKQAGSAPYIRNASDTENLKVGSARRGLSYRDRKGGDPSEWPPSLRVREFPTSQKAEAILA